MDLPGFYLQLSFLDALKLFLCRGSRMARSRSRRGSARSRWGTSRTSSPGTGTISGLAFYMYGGNWVVTKFNTSNKTLDIVMGIIFIIAAAIQLYRMIWGSFV